MWVDMAKTVNKLHSWLLCVTVLLAVTCAEPAIGVGQYSANLQHYTFSPIERYMLRTAIFNASPEFRYWIVHNQVIFVGSYGEFLLYSLDAQIRIINYIFQQTHIPYDGRISMLQRFLSINYNIAWKIVVYGEY